MKRIALAVLAAGLLATATHAMDMPAAPSNHGFDMMKGLVGDWQGTTADGKAMSSHFELVSSGSALLERMTMPGESEMMTVYHCDGNKLMMTHYCSTGNQPRMRARPAAAGAKTLTFDFMDATNLAGKDAMHMHGLTVDFTDADHVVETWTLHDKGKDQVMPIKMERKK